MLTKSSLSTAEKRLLEKMQHMNYGRIEGLSIRDGQPILKPGLRIAKDVKFGASDSGPRAELGAEDFALKREHIELFENFRRLGDGIIECIEVKAGLPFRMTTVEERM